jgi:hypothetical protein
MPDYKFTRISKNLYDKIKELYKLSFSLIESEQYIENKYDTSMFGLRDLGYLAEAEDKSPAAYYGIFPITMLYHGLDMLAAQSGDTMTSPYHQKKGLFTQLAKETYKLAADNKIKLVYGFPNENSYPGFKDKLDWKFTGLLQNYSIVNNTIPLCEVSYKYPLFLNIFRHYTALRLSKFKLPPDEDNILTINTEQNGVKKDNNFLEYKMRSPDVYFININNFNLLIKVNNHLQIGSVAKFGKDRLPDFSNTVKRLGVLLGCRQTIFAVSKNYWLNDYLKTTLKPSDGMPIGFYVIDESLKIEDFAFTLADFDTF